MKKLLNILIQPIKKYQSIILYGIFGVLTTIVNILSYTFLTRFFNLDLITSNVLAWIIAVAFAYVTNRSIVFQSEAKTKKHVLKEIVLFFLARVATLLLETALLYVCVELLHFNDIIIKVIANIIVILLNYVFSKWFIFTKKDKQKN